LKKQWQDLITSLTAPIGNQKKKWTNKGCVTYTVALPFTLKSNYLKAKRRRIMETQIFHHAKIIIFRKSSKRNQNPSRYYYNSIITHLKFQHKPKYRLSKILI